MLIRCVVDDEIHHDADIAAFCFGDQAIHIGQGAIVRIDSFVIGDVITEIGIGRAIDW